jgi:DNA-binding CsgD family transcriptional regulator
VGEQQQSIDPSSLNGYTSYSAYACYLAQLIACSQQIWEVGDERETQLAQGIASMTHEQVHLYLHQQSLSSTIMMPLISGRRGFLVHWDDVVYGSLQVIWPDGSPDQPVLPAALCERLARDCGWCLHMLEHASQRRRQLQRNNEDAQQKVQDLSASEREVLRLMVLGFSTRTIAETLHVSKRTIETHQRHIYQILDVHSQREAILIGLAAGMTTS